MYSNDKRVSGKTGKSSVAIILYIAAAVAALIGVALLIDNIYIFKSTIDQYVAQGYPAADVKKSLIPTQLLPGIFEPIALYGGVTLILLGVGSANKKLSKYLAAVTDSENSVETEEEKTEEQDGTEEKTVGQDRADSEGLEFAEPADKDLP